MQKVKKASSYIAQYPVLRTAQSALHFTSLTDLFTQTPSRLLWEASSHTLQLMREGNSYTYPPLSHLFSWVNWSNVEWKHLPKVLTPQPGFEPGFSYSRVWSSTPEPLRSTCTCFARSEQLKIVCCTLQRPTVTQRMSYWIPLLS